MRRGTGAYQLEGAPVGVRGLSSTLEVVLVGCDSTKVCYSCCHFYGGAGWAVAKAVSGVAGYLEGCKQRRGTLD